MRIKRNGSGAYHLGMFGRPRMLLQRAGEGGGSGGGEGGDDGDEDKAFTEKFNKLFHKAMGERDSRLEKKLMKNFETSLGAKLEEMTTKLSETMQLKTKEGEPGEGGSDKARGKDGKFMPPEMAAEIAKIKKDAQDAREMAEKFKKQAEDEKTARAKTEERQMLVTALSGKVKPSLIDMVVDQLHAKHVTRDPDTGKVLWKGDGDDVLPFTDGVVAWTKSDFGKEVAPPREARGSGGRGGQGDDGGQKGPMTYDQLGAIISGSISQQR